MKTVIRDDSVVAAVEGLCIRYGRRSVIENVSLKVARGEVAVLLGRNGAGKTSLVRCFLGQQRASAGAVRLFGEDAWGGRCAAMGRTGVVPEGPDAPPEMTARLLATFCARLYPHWATSEALTRFARFDVPLDVRFERLSKGQKGALMLTLALGHEPELLVLDDPTLGLDSIARRGFYEELLGDLADRGTTVFVTTHDLTGIEGVAQHVAILRAGRLAVDEPLEGLKARFRRLRFTGEDGGDREVETCGPFHAVSTRAHAWGREVVVSDFDESRYLAWQASSASVPEVESVSLEDVFAIVAGDDKGVAQ